MTSGRRCIWRSCACQTEDSQTLQTFDSNAGHTCPPCALYPRHNGANYMASMEPGPNPCIAGRGTRWAPVPCVSSTTVPTAMTRPARVNASWLSQCADHSSGWASAHAGPAGIHTPRRHLSSSASTADITHDQRVHKFKDAKGCDTTRYTASQQTCSALGSLRAAFRAVDTA